MKDRAAGGQVAAGRPEREGRPVAGHHHRRLADPAPQPDGQGGVDLHGGHPVEAVGEQLGGHPGAGPDLEQPTAHELADPLHRPGQQRPDIRAAHRSDAQ